MKCIQIIILLIFISSCKTEYEGIKRIETQVNYRHNIYGEPIKRKKWKRKIEYRIYDKDEKLMELGTYGEDNSYSESKWNPIDSSLQVISYNISNYKKLDFIDFFKYDKKGKIIERTSWRCRDNKIKYLEDKYIFNYETDSTSWISYKSNGEIWSSQKSKLKIPFALEDEVYNQKLSNVGTRIILTEKEEYIYNKENRLVKIIYKDKYDNLLGFTKYKYKKLKKRTQ